MKLFCILIFIISCTDVNATEEKSEVYIEYLPCGERLVMVTCTDRCWTMTTKMESGYEPKTYKEYTGETGTRVLRSEIRECK